MSYLTQTAGTAHAITVEMRVGSGAQQIKFSSARGALHPLVGFNSVGAQLNPLTTRRTLAGVAIEIADAPAVRQIMAPAFLVQARLSAEATQSTTSLKVRQGDGADLVAALGPVAFEIHVGSETVIVQAVVAGAEFDTLTVVRAAGSGDYKTDAIGHPAGTTCGASPQSWVGRLISEVVIYPNGDERLVALYAVDGVPEYTDGKWVIPTQDALGFFNRTVGRGMGTGRVADGALYPGGNLNLRGLLIEGSRYVVEDSLVAGTYHLAPAVMVSGESVITSWYPRGAALGELVPGFGLIPDAYLFPWIGPGAISLEGPMPLPGDELEPHIILRGPAQVVVGALISSAKGDLANGPRDVIPGNSQAQTGCGVPSYRINQASFDRLLGGLPNWSIVVEAGALLLDVLERELAFLNLFVDIDTNGLVALREIQYPVSTQACDHQLTDSSLHATASEELRLSGRMINRVQLKADYDILKGEHLLEMNLPGIVTAENSLGNAISFEPTWLPPPRDVVELEAYGEQLADIVARWGSPRPVFAVEHDFTQHLVRVGDTAAVINARLPDGAGGFGVSVGCLVTAVDSDLEAGLVRITAEAVGSSRGGYFCPAGEVKLVNAIGGGLYDLTLNTAAASRLVSGLLEAGANADEADYFAIGWAVAGYDYATGLVAWAGEVTAIVGAVLTVSAPLPPLVGEVVAPADYGTFGSLPAALPPLDAQPGNRRPGLQPTATGVAYLWLADANAKLGPGNDAAKEWI